MIDKINVVIATFNGERYIRKQLLSVLNQSLPVNQIIICDDCSNDNTLIEVNKIIQERKISNVIIINNNENLGPTRTFLKAINKSKSEFTILSDQDDVWFENKVSLLYDAAVKLDKLKPGVCFSNLELINSSGKKIGQNFWNEWSINPKSIELRRMTAGNIVPGCSMLINKKMVEILSQNKYNKISFHDHFIMMISAHYQNFIPINKCLMLYRIHNDSVTIKQKKHLNKLGKIKSKLIWSNDNPLELEIENAKIFLKIFEKNLNKEEKVFFEKFISLRKKNRVIVKMFITFCARNWKEYPVLNKLINLIV